MAKQKNILAYVESFHDEVTGSSFLLTICMPDKRTYHIMVDCGLYQETQYVRLNYTNEINASTIDAILITHNHIDHTGRCPNFVKNGYRNPIYTTPYTKELMYSFLANSANQQIANLADIKKEFPNEKFEIPYTLKDVQNTLELVESINFNTTKEILDGVKVTFFPNGHLLGAATILIQLSSFGYEDVNFLFTGDYKDSNIFFNVPKLPEWVLELPLTIVTESTYGTTEFEDKTYCFDDNIKEAIEANQDILIGAFAQGRMQEILYRIKYLQDIGIIPDYYQIVLDGPLGIETCFTYRRLMYSSSNFHDSLFISDVSFFPKNLCIATQQERNSILSDNKRKIVITTSGMLSHGPAATYVPIFLQNKTLIHLTGFAAPNTLARKLIDSFESETEDEILINGDFYPSKKATIKWTNEFSSHATAPELINFLRQFSNLKSIIINHGETSVKEAFKMRVLNNVSCRHVEIINREKIFIVGTYGLIKQMQSKKKLPPSTLTQKSKKSSRHETSHKKNKKVKNFVNNLIK